MSRRLARLAALAVAGGGLAAAAPQEPAAPHGVAGIAGISTVSRLVRPGASEAARRLDAVYLFPDRARFRLEPDAGLPQERRMIHRFGGRVWVTAEGETSSRELHGAARDAVLLQLELRRAALLWPDGFAWSPEPPAGGEGGGAPRARRAPVGRTTGSAAERIGSLVAHLDQAGQPQRLVALARTGEERGVLVLGGWQEHQGRRVPGRIELRRHGRVLWEEALAEVETRVRFVDAFFQPPDRRGAGPSMAPDVLSVALQELVFRRQPFAEPEPDLGRALARARRLMAATADELERHALELDPVPTLELDEKGRARAIVLRVSRPPGVVPPELVAGGWKRRPARSGLALVVEDDSALPSALRRLRSEVSSSVRTGIPYCRAVPRPGGFSFQLYLPLGTPGG